MRWALVLVIFLCGCTADKDITKDVFSGIHSDISVLTQQLPTECKTSPVEAQISAIKEQVNLAEKSCNKDVSDCRADVRLWKFRFFGLVLVIVSVIGIGIYRKVVKII